MSSLSALTWFEIEDLKVSSHLVNTVARSLEDEKIYIVFSNQIDLSFKNQVTSPYCSPAVDVNTS